MKLDNFYRLVYSGDCLHLYCYIHNVSADVSFGLLQLVHYRERTRQQIILPECINNLHRVRIQVIWVSKANLHQTVPAINSDSDAYQEEMNSLRENLHYNNYPESITLAPRNLDWMTNNTWKLITVRLPYVKG